jgi:hypothetical protein
VISIPYLNAITAWDTLKHNYRNFTDMLIYHNIFMVLKTFDKLDICNFESAYLLQIHSRYL